MKKYLFSICVLVMYFEANAVQTFESGNYAVSSFVPPIDDFTIVVEEGAVVSPLVDNITVDGPVHLFNSGHINGPVDTDGNIVHVYNSGVISGGINMSSGGEVIQHVRYDTEFTNIGLVGGELKLEVDDYQNVDFNQIKSMNAGSFTVTGNSSIVINDFNEDWQNWDINNVELGDDIVLIINNPDSVHSGDVIKYTKSGHPIDVIINNLDKMYKRELTFVGNGIALNIVRNTNYESIFDEYADLDENTGAALDAIRDNNENDKLLRAMDSANSVTEINRLKGRSYRFNHGIMLRPLKTINNFSLVDAVKNEIETGIGITPYYTFSNKMDGFGGRIYGGYKHENLYFDAGVSMHRFNYEDSLNDFSGISYAFDIKSRQVFDKFFVGETFGLSLTDFKADYVSSNNQIKNNPFGTSCYGDVFVGYNFDVAPDIKVSPNIGFAYQKYKVADVVDADSFGHLGADAKYSFSMDGIKYEYSLSAGAGTNGFLFLTTSVGFMSITDNAGADVEIGVIKDDLDVHYKFSLNAKVLF